MREGLKKNVGKWLAEGLLIFLSVLLAFYFENLRQERADKKRLIANLKELRASIAVDGQVFSVIARTNIPMLDTNYRQTLDLIEHKERVQFILQQIYNHDPLNYRNWTLGPMLQGDQLTDLDRDFKNGLWEYKMKVENIENGDLATLLENNKKLADLVFTGIKFKNGFSKIPGVGDDQPLVRYREYRDSSVVYSDAVKGYLLYNLAILQSLQYQMKNHIKDVTPVVKGIDEKIEELEK